MTMSSGRWRRCEWPSRWKMLNYGKVLTSTQQNRAVRVPVMQSHLQLGPKARSLKFSTFGSLFIILPPLPPFISMFRLWCSKIPSLRLLAAGVSSSLRRPCCPLSSLSPSFTRNPITTTTSRLPSHRLSNMLDPKSLMEDLESERFNYTTGRFL